jgi:hypothetical protein
MRQKEGVSVGKCFRKGRGGGHMLMVEVDAINGFNGSEATATLTIAIWAGMRAETRWEGPKAGEGS